MARNITAASGMLSQNHVGTSASFRLDRAAVPAGRRCMQPAGPVSVAALNDLGRGHEHAEPPPAVDAEAVPEAFAYARADARPSPTMQSTCTDCLPPSQPA